MKLFKNYEMNYNRQQKEGLTRVSIPYPVGQTSHICSFERKVKKRMEVPISSSN